MIGLQDHASSAPAITATGSALGDKGFAMEGNGSFAAMASASVNFDLVNKHPSESEP